MGARGSLCQMCMKKKLISILIPKSITIITEQLIPAIHTYMHNRHIYPFKAKLYVYSRHYAAGPHIS